MFVSKKWCLRPMTDLLRCEFFSLFSGCFGIALFLALSVAYVRPWDFGCPVCKNCVESYEHARKSQFVHSSGLSYFGSIITVPYLLCSETLRNWLPRPCGHAAAILAAKNAKKINQSVMFRDTRKIQLEKQRVCWCSPLLIQNQIAWRRWIGQQ